MKSVEEMFKRTLHPNMQDISTEFEFLKDGNNHTDANKIFLVDEFHIYLYDFY